MTPPEPTIAQRVAAVRLTLLLISVLILGLTGCGGTTCQSIVPRAAGADVHLVIANFAGVQPTGQKIDAALAEEARARLVGHLQQVDTEGKLQLTEVSDTLRNHKDARLCLKNLGADAVLWGTFDQNTTSGSGSLFTMRPSVTLALEGAWVELTGAMNLASLGDLDFTQVTQDRAMFLVPFLLAIKQMGAGSTESAAEIFERSRSLLSGTDANVARLTLFPALAHLALGRSRRAFDLLTKAEGSARGLAPREQAIFHLVHALAAESEGQLEQAFRSYSLAGEADKEGHAYAAAIVSGQMIALLKRGDPEAALALASKFVAPTCTREPHRLLECTAARLWVKSGQIVALRLLSRDEAAQTLQRELDSEQRAVSEGAKIEQLTSEAKAFAELAPHTLRLAQAAMLRVPDCSSFFVTRAPLGAALWGRTDDESDYERVGDHIRRMIKEFAPKLPDLGAIHLKLGCMRLAAFAAGGQLEQAEEELVAQQNLLDELKVEGAFARVDLGLWRAYLRDRRGQCTEGRAIANSQLAQLDSMLGADAPMAAMWRKYASTGEAPWRGTGAAACKP